MYTLFIDTHSDKIILILYKEEKIFCKKEVETKQSHSITTMPILVEILEENKIDIKDVKEVIVVNGPGSFTGERIGVTIAKTLAYTLQIPIKTMSSLLIKAISFSHQQIRIVEKEKNGVFLGTFDDNNKLIEEYVYLHNHEYLKEEKDVEEVTLDYEKILEFSKSLEAINPHAVKPLYVKKIEVQK